MLTLLWFSRDLRLTDNPALAAAIARGGPIVPVFVLDDPDAGKWAPGGASRWWLHGSLSALDDSLRQRGNCTSSEHLGQLGSGFNGGLASSGVDI